MSAPVVAIIGRPNVGKSTFFNRVLGERRAVVHDRPGITRDRNTARAEWAGHWFLLVDTGGFVPGAAAGRDAVVRRQAEIAIELAQVVLFMVDAKTGITDLDQAIARDLRRRRVKSLLVVNKVDKPGDPVTHGVYPCAGDDEWCVISVRDDTDWNALTTAMGREGLDRTQCEAEIASWTRTLDKEAVARILQQAGVPAGPMNRPADVLADPQIQHRKLFADMAHPLFDILLPTETDPAPYRDIPPAELRPAPMPGEHSREVCQKVLGLDPAEIDKLIADGALFTSPISARAQGKVG